MLSLVAAALLAVDGGGEYVTYVDLEFPSWNPLQSDPGITVYHQTHDSEVGPGATSLDGWDAGMILDPRGLRTVRGLPGSPSVWYGGSTSGWDDASGASFKVEFCHSPDFDSADGVSHAGPDWSGTNYALDVIDGSAHSLFLGFGHASPSNIYARVGHGAGETTLESVAPVVTGSVYCTSVEGIHLGAGLCNLWMRHDRCRGGAWDCRASTIVAFNTSGTSLCPNAWAAWLFGQRYTSSADSSQHVCALRVGRK